MKANVVKIILAVGLALLLSVICYVLAPDADNRNWISFGVSAATLIISLIMAMGINYNCGKRNVNIKLVAAIGVFVTLITNIAFSCFMYSILIYIAVTGILTLLFVASVIGLYKPSEIEK